MPRQLPFVQETLAGRETESNQLTAVSRSSNFPTSGRVVVVTGGPGIGKTSLVVHWANARADQFPDGQIYLNMQQEGSPITPDQALAILLNSLGIPHSELPPDRHRLAELYRSLLVGRTMLIVLDNVLEASQVRHLLPATASVMLVVISRNQLQCLRLVGVDARIIVGPLSPGAASQVLTSLDGARRLRRHEGQLTSLVTVCGGLPLALRIAAINLAEHSGLDIEEYLAQVTGDDPLTALSIGAAGSELCHAFETSFRTLDPEAQNAFLRLASLGQIKFSSAAISDQDERTAQDTMVRLAAEHFVVPVDEHRYQIPKLLWHYGRARAVTDGMLRT